MSVLSTADRERARYHLGYMNVSQAPAIQVGIPRPVETMFLVEQAFDLVLPAAVERVVAILDTLDNIEAELREAPLYLAAQSIGDMVLRPSSGAGSHPNALEREYTRWAERLADLLGCPLYPGSHRFGSPGGINRKVLP